MNIRPYLQFFFSFITILLFCNGPVMALVISQKTDGFVLFCFSDCLLIVD